MDKTLWLTFLGHPVDRQTDRRHDTIEEINVDSKAEYRA